MPARSKWNVTAPSGTSVRYQISTGNLRSGIECSSSLTLKPSGVSTASAFIRVNGDAHIDARPPTVHAVKHVRLFRQQSSRPIACRRGVQPGLYRLLFAAVRRYVPNLCRRRCGDWKPEPGSRKRVRTEYFYRPHWLPPAVPLTCLVETSPPARPTPAKEQLNAGPVRQPITQVAADPSRLSRTRRVLVPRN